MTYKSVRTLAKEQGINLNRLLEILKMGRPEGSKFEEEFVMWLKGQLPDNAEFDGYGNIICRVGEKSTTMWSCHTDTVHSKGGPQNVRWEGDVLHLNEGKPGQCLGADDGAGIWLMLELIDAGKPGLYIFHRAEEVGGLGSSYLVKNTPELVEGIERAIAFDRKDVDSIITHQSGGRCCSNTFAEELASRLNETVGFKYSNDPTGSFTDTANYTDLIPECTNLSVGYYKQHGPKETQDVAHLVKLRGALLEVDFETLPTERDPSEVDYDDWGYGYGSNYGSWRNSYNRSSGYSDQHYGETPMEKVLRERRFTLALYFEDQGISAEQLDADLSEFSKEYWSRKRVEDEQQGETHELLYCEGCADEYLPAMRGDVWSDNDPCPNCGEKDTYVVEYEFDKDPYEDGFLP